MSGGVPAEPAICVKGGGGILFPLFGDSEQEWPRGLRIFLYLLGLVWCFMGVGIISDVFMAAIEKVTSKKTRVYDKEKKRYRTVEVWNATVANLTLMALGSSAPEILLNVIDIFAKEFFLEGLGPSTIVGSAAFNLLMIIAVCIVAIPDGQVRFIKETTVYICTAIWSVFAYLWLIVILLLVSPHVVEVWEGVLTFLFFPLLTFLAYACDRGWIGGSKADDRIQVHPDMSPEEIAEAYAELRRQHGADLTDDRAARMLAAIGRKPRSRAQYRIGISAAMFGGKQRRVPRQLSMALPSTLTHLSKRVVPIAVEEEPACTFYFPVTKLAVMESAGYVTVKVMRGGDLRVSAEVQYSTESGSADAGGDFEHAEGWLKFDCGVEEGEIRINIMDDDNNEDDEHFFLKLLSAKAAGEKRAVVADDSRKALITIIDDDDAGVLSFACDGDELVVPGSASDSTARIAVQRKQGACGEVSVRYFTEEAGAIAGKQYETTEGTLVFENGQLEGVIEVKILGCESASSGGDRFRLFLAEPQNGAKLDKNRDGGEERNILTVSIGPDVRGKESGLRIKQSLTKSWDKSVIGSANWATQFKEAVLVSGGDDDDEGGGPSIGDYIGHVIACPWKVLFAFVPPTDFCGGWLCFFCALLAIGFVTMMINDMASLLGCTMCISDEITAITFVALGTSLPDTFASMTAAKAEPHADSSVGNVTGSNSVNVFLGLGLPWMFAAIAWAAQSDGVNEKWQSRFQFDPELSWLGAPGSRQQAFVVKAGSLAFSVGVFSSCAVVCIGILAVRRMFCGGELGGAKRSKYASAACLVLLWLLYIALSSWKSLEAGGGGCAK